MKTENDMPDVIYAVCGQKWWEYADPKIYRTTKYHHDDIHAAVVTERDTLKALCEQMAGALVKSRQLVSKGAENGWNFEIGEWINPLFEHNGNITDALTAYQKYKGGE